jgi:hypothetical protein
MVDVYAIDFSKFIVCEGFNTPPFRAVKKVLNPETKRTFSPTLPKQHYLAL